MVILNRIILKGIEDFGQGDLKTRLPKFDVPDFQKIAAKSLNMMWISLEKF